MNSRRRAVIANLLAASLLSAVGGCARRREDPHVDLSKPSAKAQGRFKSRAVARDNKNAEIGRWLAQIDEARLVDAVTALAGLRTRWSHSSELQLAHDWIVRAFRRNGHVAPSVRSFPFSMPNGRKVRNVLCGPARPDLPFVLLCAHYDSITHAPTIAAPGADDNASGVSVMLEVARVLAMADSRAQVMFAAFAGEEQGLVGSQALAGAARSAAWPIELVINLDMVGWVQPQQPRNLVIEFDQGNAVPANDAASKFHGEQMAQAAADYTQLEIEHTNIWNSDYMPFEAIGAPCIGVYDNGSDAGHYHAETDVPAVVSGRRLVDVATMVLAFLLSKKPFNPVSGDGS